MRRLITVSPACPVVPKSACTRAVVSTGRPLWHFGVSNARLVRDGCVTQAQGEDGQQAVPVIL